MYMTYGHHQKADVIVYLGKLPGRMFLSDIGGRAVNEQCLVKFSKVGKGLVFLPYLYEGEEGVSVGRSFDLQIRLIKIQDRSYDRALVFF